MDEVEDLRRQAQRARRLAALISDRQASEALISHAATLLDRAQSLEAQITSPALVAGGAEEESET